ncbi:MAG: DUF2911 domain-containing protein [Ferruginibacter sp.]
MQLNKILLFVVVICCTATFAPAQQAKKTEEVCYNPNAKGDTSKRSIKSAAVGKIGDASISINYHSPGVRGRKIWGGLVPYNDVWVTGAHNATNIEIDKDFMVAGTTIPKGKYAIFTIPGKEVWTIIINKNWEQHLTDDYLQKEDVVRIKVKPIKQKKITERLQYYIEDDKNGNGKIAIAWELLRIEFNVSINK